MPGAFLRRDVTPAGLFRRGRGLRGGQEIDFDGLDAAALHLENGEAALLVEEGIARFGDALQSGDDEAGEGFKAFVARQA